jgi:lipopolysaccharide biosynthesis glycosyltransferase
MNKIPVAFTFDKRIILGAAVSIKSLLDSAHSDTQYDIHIIHSDLTEKIRREFERLVAGSRHTMSFHSVEISRFKDAPKSRGSWREIVYYRMLIPEILKDHDKVIYSDVDVFFKQDMSEIFKQDYSDFELGAVRAERNTPSAIGHKYFPENLKDYIYWSGFLIINCERLRRENTISKFFENIIAFKDRLKFFDLDLINVTCQKIKDVPFKYVTLESIYEFEKMSDAGDYKYLKDVYSDEELTAAKKDPAIIHYAGELGKPWHRKSFPEYYEKCVQSLPRGLRKTTFRDFRKRLFSKR